MALGHEPPILLPVPSVHIGAAQWYIYDDHLYKVNKRFENAMYLMCASKKLCKAKALVKDGDVRITAPHNHGKVPVSINNHLLKTRCIARARDSNLDIKNIFDEERNRFHQNMPTITYNSVYQQCYRVRRTKLPPLPRSFAELGRVVGSLRFGKTIEGQNFFQTYQNLEENGENLIFAEPELLQGMAAHEEIHMDATFNVLPNVPQMYQLFTVHFIYNNYSFPAVWALMTSKSQIAYEAILRHMMTLQPGWSPRLVLTDYEIGLQNAVKNVLGDAVEVKGCFFHYCKAIFKIIVNMGLRDSYVNNHESSRVIRKILTLPLLPANQCQAGLDILAAEAEGLPTGNIKDKVMNVLSYLQTFWYERITPDVFSVYNSQPRTNNNIESFHNILLNKIENSTQNIWQFLNKIRELADGYQKDYVLATHGQSCLQNKKFTYVLCDVAIVNLSRRLSSGELNMAEFLMAASYRTYPEHGLNLEANQEDLPILYANHSSTDRQIMQDADGRQVVLVDPRFILTNALREGDDDDNFLQDRFSQDRGLSEEVGVEET